MNFASVRVITEDVDRLVDFYETVTKSSAVRYTPQFAELQFPAFTLAIGHSDTVHLFGSGSAHAADNHTLIIEFLADDVDAEYERLRALNNFEWVQAPTTMPWGNRSILLRDPDGNLVNLFHPVTDDAIARFERVPEISGISHHLVSVNGAELHYVSAGTEGTPILLVHGFPETWWAFCKLIPLLAERHRVFAVDLRGFGDSSTAGVDHDSTTAAEDLHQLISHLGVGPVHLTGQDISGSTVFRLATAHPEDVRSFTAIEMGLAGYGLEGFADVTHGGSWHIGVLAAPGLPEMLFVGRERDLLGNWAFPSMTAVTGSITDEDVAEFARTYARPDGWRGAEGLYRSMLSEGDEIKAVASSHPLTMPVLAVGAGGGALTSRTFSQVATGPVVSVQLEGVGHYVAMEAPDALSTAILDFLDTVQVTRQDRHV